MVNKEELEERLNNYISGFKGVHRMVLLEHRQGIIKEIIK